MRIDFMLAQQLRAIKILFITLICGWVGNESMQLSYAKISIASIFNGDLIGIDLHKIDTNQR